MLPEGNKLNIGYVLPLCRIDLVEYKIIELKINHWI